MLIKYIMKIIKVKELLSIRLGDLGIGLIIQILMIILFNEKKRKNNKCI